MVNKDYSELEKELRALENAYADLFEKNQILNAKLELIQAEFGLALNEPKEGAIDPKTQLALYIHAMTPSNRKEGTSFEDWQKDIQEIERKLAREKMREYRSLAFREAMRLVIAQSDDFRKVPFFSYDFYNQEVFYTQGLSKLLNISEKGVKHISLPDIIRGYIPKEARKEVIEAFHTGKELKNYEFRRADDSLKKLVLHGYPLFYSENDYQEPVGVGVFLHDPENIDFGKKTGLYFAASVKREVKRFGEHFKVIGRGKKFNID
jgi:hypothetical protein